MAEKRMFTKKITDGDVFTAMPPTTQCLYFHLCMGADDDGFSNNIRIAMFNAHATTDDFNTLVQKKFIIPFESGVIVIKHWKMHNYIQNDRYHETKFIEEKSNLVLKENGVYSLDTECIQNVSSDKIRLDKNSIDKNRKEKKEPVVYFPEDEKLNDAFKEYVKMRKQNKAPMTDHAVTLAINKLKKLSDGDNDVAIAILEQSIMNSWKGLFELKGQVKTENKAAGINWDEV